MTITRARQNEIDAARWVVRLDRHGRSPALMAELDAWLENDDRRKGAFLQAEAAWASLDSTSRAEETLAETENDISLDYDLHQRRSRRWILGAGGTAIAASLVGGLVFFRSDERYGTALGEIRRVPLGDGSIAAVNTASVIKVAIAEKTRNVRIEQGEAWFQVAKDRSRPFVVEAGRVRVMAVGTAFSVRRQDNGAEVLVTEGVVEAWADGAEGHRIRLTAGERAFVAENAAIEARTTEPSEVDRALAWRTGKIDLEGEPLSEAVSEFNRYNARKIELADPALAQERFFGIFRVDDPTGFANAVKRSLGVPVSFDDPTVIRIGQKSG